MTNEMSRRASARVAAASDLELARLAGNGDAAAFRTIMQRNNERLYRVARSVLANDGDAEDAVQEAYLKAYAKLNGFKGDAALSTWLTRIVLNEALERLRRRRRSDKLKATISEDAPTAQIVRFPGMEQGLDPERAAATRQVAAIIERAIDALPLDFRTVFVLRCVEEMSVEETAAQLEIPEATVKTRLHRARRALRRLLDDEVSNSLTGTFPFGGTRCARMTERVVERLAIHASSPPRPGGSGNPEHGL
jgi:RNA polymerase sigma-70 factor, ECF subfamily